MTNDNAILKLTKACNILGWDLAVPDSEYLEDKDVVNGLIIGEEFYVAKILAHLPSRANAVLH